MSDLPPPSSMPPEVPSEIPPATPPPEPPPTPPVDQVPAPPPSGDDPQPKDANERTMGLLMHLCPLAGMLLQTLGIPFGHIVAPLVFWLIKKNESPYLDAHGKEVLNFQINVGAASLVGFLLVFVCIGVPLLIALGIATLVFMIMAAIAVSDGKFYKYPWIYRVIK